MDTGCNHVSEKPVCCCAFNRFAVPILSTTRALRDKRRRGVTIPALMDQYGISRASVFRYLQKEKREA